MFESDITTQSLAAIPRKHIKYLLKLGKKYKWFNEW